MKKFVQLTVILFIIAGLSGFILGVINDKTKGPILAAENAKQAKAIQAIFTEASGTPEELKIDHKNIISYFEVNDKDGNSLGHVFKVNAPDSYSGTLIFLVGIDADGKVVGTSYLSLQETPGLGTKVDPTKSKLDVTKKFNEQFKGLDDVSDTDTISGATYSSTAVKTGIQIVLDYYKTNMTNSNE